MAIKFYNIRSREVQVAETEPQITAMWASSDHSPNITQGQDFGWRLAPEVVVEMKQIKQNYSKIMEIAQRYNLPTESVGEPEILRYISDKTTPENAPLGQEEDYTDEYDAEIRRLEREAKEAENPIATTTTTTTEEPTTTTTTTEAPVKTDTSATTTTTTTKVK